jgi:putative transposase
VGAFGVSRSGFYEWRTRPASATSERREEFKALVRGSFDDSDGTYGYRRVHADLVAWGVRCGPELVRSLMRELGLVPCQPRPWRFNLTAGDGQEHHMCGWFFLTTRLKCAFFCSTRNVAES